MERTATLEVAGRGLPGTGVAAPRSERSSPAAVGAFRARNSRRSFPERTGTVTPTFPEGGLVPVVGGRTAENGFALAGGVWQRRGMRSLAIACVILFGPMALAASPDPRARIELSPGVVKPGDPLLITVENSASEPTGTVGGRPLRFFALADGTYQAITGLAVELEPGTLRVRVELQEARSAPVAPAPALQAGDEVVDAPPGAGLVALEADVEVVDPRYPSRELQVASKFVDPPRAVQRQMKADREAFERATHQPFGPARFKGDFQWPRQARITAPYGDLRVFNGKKQSQHYGVDLDGPIGSPVFAANDGKVVLVRDCYASGKTVIVDHGAGLYTLYFHLSAYRVKQGQTVKRGQRLGDVGATGRVTGPHLHWSVKADELYVDGATLLQLPFARWAPVAAKGARGTPR